MIRSFYFTCSFLFIATGLNAQTNSIHQWIEAHPSVLFVESADASPEFLENLDLNGVDYIIYQEEILESDISTFESKTKPLDIEALDESEATQIKMWLAEHRDVKIVKHSDFKQLNDTKQALYQSINALILNGETITIEDINEYE